MKKIIRPLLLMTTILLAACQGESNFDVAIADEIINKTEETTPSEPMKDADTNDTSADQQKVSKITFTTAKSVGQDILLEIFAEKEDQKDVWIDLNNNGVKDEGESVTQFQGSDTQRGKYYTIQSQTITLYGNVTYFNCRLNEVTALDVSENPGLKELWCTNNKIKSIDVSKNKALDFLCVSANELTSLDISNNTLLTDLWCYTNQLKELNLTNNKELRYINCSDNQLTSLDVSNNLKLVNLHYNINPMVVDISKNVNLKYLSCSKTNVVNLDLTKQPELLWLFCCSNGLKSVDISTNKKLTYLDCSNNEIQTLDLSNNPLLERLHCHDNKLIALDVSKNQALLYAECQDNNLDVEAVNNFFRSLRDITDLKPELDFYKHIQLQGNPGAWDAETSIALKKGWKVEF